MKLKSLFLTVFVLMTFGALRAQDAGAKPRNDVFRAVSMEEIGDVKITEGPLTLNNFNIVHEKAFFGGYKITVEVSGKNRSKKDLNYTIYVLAQNLNDQTKVSEDVACFKLEPDFNIHGAGKLEQISDSGLLSEADFKKINSISIKLVMQKGE
jgi:hypothetical protein